MEIGLTEKELMDEFKNSGWDITVLSEMLGCSKEKTKNELNKIKESIPKETYYTLQTILRTVNTEFNKLHNKIETELDARAYKD